MIKENLEKILATIPSGVRLVAVSKLKTADDILEAYSAGQRLFGENYATELRDKQPLLPADIEWHFIGHLQGKQLKYYIPFVSMIHGVDSLDHLAEVDRAAAKAGRTVDVLLQVHVAQEETKFGFAPVELENLDHLDNLSNVRICGLMGMASNTPDTARVRADFHSIRLIFERLKSGLFAGNPAFSEVSMGMSHDYRIAIDEGSTIVRIGSSIFGPRDYSKKPTN
ncbi:MAG: YggS family pyridoxal phosphate-dependent enzyme [Bacteroidales bacterium]|nr:YggS family pyridoxal phosphate-dependent enzyme [Bacteroidales bacterium]